MVQEKVQNDASGTAGVTAYLEQMLQELEAQQGHKDEEAVAALAQLKQNISTLARAEAVAASASDRTAADVPDDVQIAGVLDRLDTRLGDLEARIDGADDPTKAILQASTQLWLGEQGLDMGPGQDEENGPISRPATSGYSRPALRGSKPPEGK